MKRLVPDRYAPRNRGGGHPQIFTDGWSCREIRIEINSVTDGIVSQVYPWAVLALYVAKARSTCHVAFLQKAILADGFMKQWNRIRLKKNFGFGELFLVGEKSAVKG